MRPGAGALAMRAPLIRRSRLTSRENGGVGKELSEGWALNFAVGCDHACPFCYSDAIWKRFPGRYGPDVRRRWGDYLLVPPNMGELIAATPWGRWRGREVMLSSTHDAFLPSLHAWAGRILEAALPAGVRFCVQTRSYLVTRYLGLMGRYAGQVRLQVSLATWDRGLARAIEPRVPPPERRAEVLALARGAGLRTGVILAPILPPCRARPDVRRDIEDLAIAVSAAGPDRVYGESLHVRGANMRLLGEALGERLVIPAGFDEIAEGMFRDALGQHGMTGVWWPEGR